MLDGDNLRHGLNRNLGFRAQDRVENVRRVGEVAKLFVDAGLIVLASLISPFRKERAMVREMVDPDEFIEIFVETPIEECERRDPKGLYARARAGEIRNFTGIDSPYEPPDNPELVLNTVDATPDELADRVFSFLEERGVI
jgi:bifunctional enzyme CysN/CysC